MARQFILGSGFGAVFVNETSSLAYVLSPGIFLDETSGAAPPAGGPNLLPIMGVGAVEPNAVDLLVSAGLFAGLLAKENPVVNRRKFLTGGTKE